MPRFQTAFSAAILAATVGFLSATPAQASSALSQGCLAVDRVAKPQATIYFSVDSTTISAQDRAQLDRIAYDGQSQSRVCVIGQADKQGNSAYNQALAAKRAKAVESYLVEHGLSTSLVEAGSRGEAFSDSFLEVLGSEKQDRRVDVYFLTNAEH